jgi:pimeloyl-ACP methyl ester carboxylesterase
VVLPACLAALAPGTSGATGEPWAALPPTPDLPAHGRSGRLTVNGASLWYAQWGEDSGGVPVVLLHGGLANSAYFGAVAATLVQHGHRVLAMDSRGHGRSGRGPQPYGYDLMASDVLGLLDHLGMAKVDLVGWSDGGIIGLRLALLHPERLRRLYAFGANVDPSGVLEDCSKAPGWAAYLARVPGEYARLSPTPASFPEFRQAMFSLWETEPAIKAADLRSIRVPTAIADGEHDGCIKAKHTRYLAAAIPNAKLVILPDVSHFAMLQDPAGFAASVEAFLR